MIVVLPHIKVQNANALSSPFTIGFPAMTAWLGAAHALQRKLNQQEETPLTFNSVGVCCHHINVHTYKGPGDFDYSIIGTGNPLTKEGQRAPFFEEPRCDLEISLLLEYTDLSSEKRRNSRLALMRDLLLQMKLASGDILACGDPVAFHVENPDEFKKLKQQLMPGHMVIERRDLMTTAMEQGENALDALLGYLQVTSQSVTDDFGNTLWQRSRKSPGWIVPIATGFHGISEIGKAQHQRDEDTPHRFAESVVTLGEFKMPTRLSLEEMLWHYHVDLEKNLYLCQQNTFKEKKNG
jgi:CRISPR-associated protein Csy2